MKVSVSTIVIANIDKVWQAWTEPEHIIGWNFAAIEWHCPKAEVDLTIGGRFKYRMEAKDKSMGFDFEGTFTEISQNKRIGYVLDDDREVSITFSSGVSGVSVVETFETEAEMSSEQQKTGWQSILNNFKKYVESAVT